MTVKIDENKRPSLLSRLHRARDGGMVVEFGFGGLILIWLLVGAMEFGMVLFTTTLMEGALRDASRYGITGQEPDPDLRLAAILDTISQRTLGLVDMTQAEVDVLARIPQVTDPSDAVSV